MWNQSKGRDQHNKNPPSTGLPPTTKPSTLVTEEELEYDLPDTGDSGLVQLIVPTSDQSLQNEEGQQGNIHF